MSDLSQQLPMASAFDLSQIGKPKVPTVDPREANLQLMPLAKSLVAFNGVVLQNEGEKHILLHAATPLGVTTYWLDDDTALALANLLVAMATGRPPGP